MTCNTNWHWRFSRENLHKKGKTEELKHMGSLPQKNNDEEKLMQHPLSIPRKFLILSGPWHLYKYEESDCPSL